MHIVFKLLNSIIISQILQFANILMSPDQKIDRLTFNDFINYFPMMRKREDHHCPLNPLMS